MCCEKKNMKVREFQKWGVYFRKRCEDYFANHLVMKKKKTFSFMEISMHVGIFGNIFSYERKECVEEKKWKTRFIMK